MESIKTKKDILEIVKFNKKISLLSFSESLKEIMKAKNKTTKELAIDSGVTSMTISRYLNNKRNPSKLSFIELCEALDIDNLTILKLMIKAGISFIPNEENDEILFYILINLQNINKKIIKNILKSYKK